MAATDEDWARMRYEYECTGKPVADIAADGGVSTGTVRDRIRRWTWTPRRTPIPRHGPPPPPPLVPQIDLEVIENHDAPLTRFTSPQRGEVDAQSASGEGVPIIDSPKAPHPNPLPSRSRMFPTSANLEPRTRAGPSSDGERGQAEPVADDPGSIVPRLQNAIARVLPAIEATLAQLATQASRPREMEQAGRALASLTRTLRELNALLAQHAAAAEEDDDMPKDIDAFRFELARRITAFVASRRGEAGDDGGPTPETK